MADPVVKLRINLDSAGAQRALDQLNRSEAFDRLRAGTQEASKAFFDAQARVVSLREAIAKVGTGNSGYDLLSKQLKQSERDAAAARQRIDELNRSLRASREASGAAPGTNNAAVSALLRQQAQIAGARQTLGVRDTQAVRGEIERLTQSYAVLRNSGVASTAELANASRALRQRVSELNRELAGQGGGGIGGALFDRLAGFAAPTAIIGGLVALGSQLVSTGNDFDALQNKLRAVFGDQRLAAEALAFVEGEARRLGLNLNAVANDYASLAAASKGTRLEGQATRDIFSAVAEASTKLGLSSAETSRAFLAIQQIISKGTVSAEELRGQLGEVLPGAFQIAARAAGVTTAELGKLLQEGKLASDEFLPKLGAEIRKTFDTDAQSRIESTRSGVERLRLEISLLTRGLAQTAANKTSGIAGNIAEQIRLLRESPLDFAKLTAFRDYIDVSSAITGKSYSDLVKQANAARDAVEQVNRAAQKKIPDAVLEFNKTLASLSSKSGFPKLPGIFETSPSGNNQDNQFSLLSTQLTDREEKLREEAALQKITGNEARVRYQIESGSLRSATQLEKIYALEIARTKDQQEAASNARKQSSAVDIADYDRRRAAVAALGSVLSAANSLASTQLDAQFRSNLIGYEAYYRQRAALQKQANDQEIQQRRAELAALSGQAVAVRNGPDAQSAEAARKLVEIEGNRAKIEQDINALKLKAIEIDTQADAAVREASQQAEQRLNDIRQQIAQQQRDAEGVAQAARLRLEQQFAQDLLGANSGTVRSFIDTQVTQAQFDVVRQQAADLTGALQTQFSTLSQGVQAGTITTAQAQGNFAAALAQSNPRLQLLLAQLRDLAGALGPDAADAVNQIAGNLQGLALQAQSPFDRLLANWQDTTAQLQTATANWTTDFSDRFATLLAGGKFRFKDFADAVIKDLIRIGTQKLFAQLLGGGGGGGGGAGIVGSIFKAFGFAQGGPVQGPGGPTDDRIPAMLSNGEYVIRNEAVRRFGVPFLDAINGTGSRRIAAFASGGLVGSSPAAAAIGSGPVVNVVNNYDFRGAGSDQVQQLLQYGEKLKSDVMRQIYDSLKRGTAPTK